MLRLIDQPITLYKYFTKDLFKFFIFALFFLIILIFFIDLIELFRRSSNKVGVNHLLKPYFIDLAGMASLKIIGNTQGGGYRGLGTLTVDDKTFIGFVTKVYLINYYRNKFK